MILCRHRRIACGILCVQSSYEGGCALQAFLVACLKVCIPCSLWTMHVPERVDPSGHAVALALPETITERL